ncbi:HypC/HybG/HupF family hydrogenase formation chaperone [Streptosporangium sp. DT93]|uniref:HypC/HybG/HupF family hydrogenase formation chaperone n=1 Tax=Streptosporangium sp. DT93 TaxID=3393428 RepID=UPI003CF5C35F
MTGHVRPAAGARATSGEALPARVVRLLEGELAIVDAAGVLEEVSVALVDPAVGDTVLVHGREAVAVVVHDTGGHDLGAHRLSGSDPSGHDLSGRDSGGRDPGGRDPGGRDLGGRGE